MILGEDIDPQLAGLAAGASVLGKLAGPSPQPVRIGSILGQLGGAMYGAQQNAVMQREKIASDRMMREAQAENLKAQVAAREEALRERQDKLIKAKNFNSILSTLDDPTDPVSILGAGIQSGAFGPQETTQFLGQVMEKRNAREQKLEELRLKSADAKLAREERESFAREMQGLQAKNREEMIRLAATLRPEPAPRPLKHVMKDGKVIYVREDQAEGQEVPPSNANRIDTQTEKLSKQLQDVKAPQASASIRTLNEMLRDVESRGAQVPGMGYLKNTKMATIFLSSEGKRIKSSMQAVANDLLAMYSGMAVTLPEAERRELEEMRSGVFGEKDFRDAWPRIVNRFNSILGNVRAGYPEEAVKAYGSRAGAVPLEQIPAAFGKPSGDGKKPWERDR